MIEFDSPAADDLTLLTKGHDWLSRSDVVLERGIWATLNGCCTLGAVTPPWEPLSGRTRAWKTNFRYRAAALLVKHMDSALISQAHTDNAYLTTENWVLITNEEADPLHRLTAYSDYVLYPREDGKAQAIKLYNEAIGEILAKRVEVRAGADA